MDKKGLIERVANFAKITKAAAKRAVEEMGFAITQELKTSGRVQFAHIGVFTVVKRAARTGHNPQTGKPVAIPAKNAVKFKMALALKEAVNP
jgi:DNA-binding protein HU-beta